MTVSRLFLLGAFIVTAATATAVVTRTAAIRGMVAEDHPSSPEYDGGALWAALDGHGLISADGDRVVLPPDDLELQEAAEALQQGRPYPPDTTAWRERHRLLASLHDQRDSQGRAVRSAVRRWNASRLLVAVRDNRMGAAPLPVQDGDRPNAWTATTLLDQPLAEAPVGVPEAFAFVNGGGAVPGMGDWKAVFGGDGGPIRLRTTLTVEDDVAGTAAVTIQVIGHLDIAASRFPAQGMSRISWRCASASAHLKPCGPGAEAVELTFSGLASGDHDLVLQVMPTASGDLRVPDLQLARADGQALPQWRPRLLPGAPRPRRSITVTSADGVPLWTDGRPTPEAAALNLLPFLGVDGRHPWSLAGRLGAVRDGQEVALGLTLDSRIQAAAQGALEDTITALFAGREDDAAVRDRRRGALVVIDPDGGALLGAAQYPAVPPGLHSYDHAALAAGDPRRDPLAPLGWTADTIPGSTGKLIVALAAALKAPGDPAVATAIGGCRPDAKGWLPCLGLGLRQQAIRLEGQAARDSISNFVSARGVETLEHAMTTPDRSPRCVPPGKDARRPAGPVVGLAKALMTSNNIYSVRLADLTDGDAARTYDAAARRRATHAPLPDLANSTLARTMETLGLFDDIDLLAPIREKTAPGGPRDGLRAGPGRSEFHALTDPRSRPARNSGAIDALAQTAIGQRLDLAPLHLARIAATIRGGAVPQPHVAATWNGVPVPAPTAVPLPAGIDLAPLRAGMKGVPETGTAAAAFAAGAGGEAGEAAACHVFAKTGTGQIGTPAQGNAGWFVGYVEPPALDALASPNILASPNTLPAVRRPLAFACLISPIHGQATAADGRVRITRTGGGTCAPAVVEFLRRLAAATADPART